MQQMPISLEAACAALPELWSPRVQGQVNNRHIKVASAEGEFPWHTHKTEDDMCLVLSGRLRVGRAPQHGGSIDLAAGEFFVAPAAIPHNTSATEETCLALLKTSTTLHTDARITPQTRTLEEQPG